jgi:hypothetical protein
MYTSMLFYQGVIPLGLLLWQGWSRSHSQLSWLLKTLLVATYLGAVSLIGIWPVLLPWWTPYLYWMAWLGLTIVSYRRVRQTRFLPKQSIWANFPIFIYVGLCIAFSAQILGAAIAYLPPKAEMIPLTFPLKNGTYYVVNGGNGSLINSHIKTLESKKFRDYRGQSYGVDLVKLNRLGSRSEGLLPKAIERYEIYGEPVYAPCNSTVIASANNAPDVVPPVPDRTRIPGNFVLLRCDKADVLLAHFRQGGVAVAVGDEVVLGQRLGEVGNSGNTNEPHLHIHAQRRGSEATPLDGDPLPMVFGDASQGVGYRYLVRNSRITDTSPVSVILSK